MAIKRYGETSTEKECKSLSKSRQIVKEIKEFGVTQNDMLNIIYVLSLELEDRDLMNQIIDSVKRYQDGTFKKSTLILGDV